MAESQQAQPKARWWPVALIVLAAAAFFGAGLNQYLSFDALAANRALLIAFVDSNLALSLAAFILAYAALVAFSLPGGAVMTLAGGFLFGIWAGGLATVVAATAGATGIFLLARTAFGAALKARAGPGLARVAEGFEADAVSYMLFLRLVPAFPFFLVNLAPAFLGVPLRTYVITTFFGIMPGTFVFASIGNGLGAVFDRGGAVDLSVARDPAVWGPLAALGLLSLVPVAVKHFRKRGA